MPPDVDPEELKKPFEGPDGQEFDDFGACVTSLMDDETSRAEAEQICGSWMEEKSADNESDDETAKVGQTLSKENKEKAMCVHDMAEKQLEDAGVDSHSKLSRTYDGDENKSFELDDAAAKAATIDDLQKADIPMAAEAQLLYPDRQTAAQVAREMGIGGADDDPADITHSHTLDGEEMWMPGETHAQFEETTKAATATDDDAGDGDASEEAGGGDDDSTKAMTDEDEGDDAPDWAKSLMDEVEQVSEEIDDIEKRVDDIEKTDDEDGEDRPDWAEDIAQKVDSLNDEVSALDDRVDRVSKATAGTQQANGGGSDEDEVSTVEKQKREIFLGAEE